MRKLGFLVGLLAVMVVSAGCGGSVSPATDAKTHWGSESARAYFSNPVPIGVKFDQPGFSVGKLGAFDGFDIDTADYIASALHFTPGSYVEVNDTDRGPMLGTSVKLVIATYSITAGREHGVDGAPIDFVGPYLTTPDALLVKRGGNYAKNDPNLDGATVCTLQGSTTGPHAASLQSGVTIITASDYSQCVQDVEDGDADAVFTDSIILSGYAEDAQYPGLVVEPTQYGSENQYGIGLPHGEVAACRALIPVIESFVASPAWETYFKAEFTDVESSDQTWQQDYKPSPSSIAGTSYCH